MTKTGESSHCGQLLVGCMRKLPADKESNVEWLLEKAEGAAVTQARDEIERLKKMK